MAGISCFTYKVIFDKNDQRGTGEQSSANPMPAGVPDAQNPTMAKGGVKQVAGLATVAHIGKQAMNYATSHVEVYTGSASKQAQVNGVMKLAGYGAAFAANPVLGAVALATDVITKVLDYNHSKNREQVALAEASRRAGVNYNKSRR